MTIVGGLFTLLLLTSQKIFSDHSEQQYKTFSENSTSRIEYQVNTLLAELRQLALKVQHNSNFAVDSRLDLNERLKDIVDYSEYLDGATIVENTGEIVGYYPNELQFVGDYMDDDYFQQAFDTNRITFSDLIRVNDREIVVMSTPISQGQKVERVVNFSMHLQSNRMIQSIFEGLEITENSFVYVTDSNGNILFHPDYQKIGNNDDLEPIMDENQKVADKVISPQGEVFYTSSTAVDGLGWEVISLVPVESTLMTSGKFQKALFEIFIVLAIITFMIITIMMIRNLKPYKRLFYAVDQLSKGQVTPYIQGVDEKTEIGAIIAKFNIMVNELQKNKQKIQESTLQIQQQRNFLNRVINHNPNLIYAMNMEGYYTMANKQFANMFQLTPNDIIGRKEIEFNPDKQEVKKNLSMNRNVILSCQAREFEDQLIDEHGNRRWYHVEKVPLTDNEGELLVLTVATDITDRKQQEELITYQAYHDELTKLPNRKLFKETLRKEIERADVEQHSIALLFLDLDRFKYINDTFGHDAGDALLQMASERLRECLNEQCSLFRLGGDEFTIIVPNIADRQEGAELAKQLLEALASPFVYEGNKFIVTSSIGISIYTQDVQTVNALIKKADLAMYKAKDQGKNTFRFYADDMETEVETKYRLEMDLYQAMDNNEFFLLYQPILSTKNQGITRMETLIRWEHPVLGLISPAEFIPISEQTGLIHAMGKWVLKTACMQNQLWLEQGLPPIKLSVNLSPVQLKNPRIVEMVQEVLTETGMNPKYLELEITESTIMENKRQVIKVLKELRGMGIDIAIDDFGTGYSSLNTLKRLPVDTLKIDRSLVNGLLEEDNDDVILNAVFDIAEKMKLTVVAEGIETEEQYNYLQDKYCHYVQGFLFSQPLTNEQLLAYVQKNIA